jgi:hypothetical protein
VDNRLPPDDLPEWDDSWPSIPDPWPSNEGPDWAPLPTSADEDLGPCDPVDDIDEESWDDSFVWEFGPGPVDFSFGWDCPPPWFLEMFPPEIDPRRN